MTERAKTAAGFLRPTHNGIEDPHRRQWSVLCYRGWCDPEYQADDIVTMFEVIAGHTLPRIVKPNACPTPDICQCRCHDKLSDEEWHRAQEPRTRRLGELERIILPGLATDEQIAEYKQLEAEQDGAFRAHYGITDWSEVMPGTAIWTRLFGPNQNEANR